MPRSYWRYIVAALGCLIALGLLGYWLYPEQPNLPGDTGHKEELAGYHAGGYDCEPARIAWLADRESLERRQASCREAEEQHRENTNSAIEARRASDAADASALAAYQQTRVAVWGLVFGGLTLVAAALAAWFAWKAADHTRRGADAAEDANRPWVVVKNVIWTKESPEISIIFENAGNSPARNFAKTVIGHVLPEPFPAMALEEPDKSLCSFLPPGATEGLGLTKPESVPKGCAYRIRISLSYDFGKARSDIHYEDFAAYPNGIVRKVTARDSANYRGSGYTIGESYPMST